MDKKEWRGRIVGKALPARGKQGQREISGATPTPTSDRRMNLGAGGPDAGGTSLGMRAGGDGSATQARRHRDPA